MTQVDHGNIVAALAVAAAESYIGGRMQAPDLAREADAIAVKALEVSVAAHDVPDAVRLLVVTMMRTAVATGARAERWREVMVALARLVRSEALPS